MNSLKLPTLPFEDYPDTARVWVFQTGQIIEKYASILDAALTPFTDTWKSHGVDVRGSWALYAEAFVLVTADEEVSDVSGCSTDGLVRVMQELSTRTGLDFFNRTACGLFGMQGLTFLPLAEAKRGRLPAPVEASFYADLTVTTLGEMRAGWPVPLAQSWIRTKTAGVL